MGSAQQKAAAIDSVSPLEVPPKAGAAYPVEAAGGGRSAAKADGEAAGLWDGDAASELPGRGPESIANPDAADDGMRNDSFQVRLERKSGVAWGFAWHVGAHAAKRLLVAGVDPASPAGLWGATQSERGLRGIERG